MRLYMSLIDVGIEKGFVEQSKGVLVIYPRRIANPAVLERTLQEAFSEGYYSSEAIIHNKPIVLKKKERIDFTEILIKLFGLTLRYGIDFKVNTNLEAGIINFYTTYKGRDIEKTFDVEMLCAMEEDYITSWLENKLQSIDDEKGNENAIK